ncbi:MAG: hypothetical protein ACOCQX_02210 [Candidatus Nanoarchaeia archaeon]
MDERLSTAGLFLGAFSIILWLFVPLGLAVSLAGLVVGILGAIENKSLIAIATVVLSASGLMLVMMNILIWGMDVSIYVNVS